MLANKSQLILGQHI